MKKFGKILGVFILLIFLSSCSKDKSGGDFLNKEGIAPYNLSKNEEYVLNATGNLLNTELISFNAPKETKSIRAKVYKLNKKGDWEELNYLQITNSEEFSEDKGTLALICNKDNSIDLKITGKAEYTGNGTPVILEEGMSSGSKKLDKFTQIELNKEIPIFYKVNTKGELRINDIDYFYDKEYIDYLKTVDLIQLVTLTFSDEE